MVRSSRVHLMPHGRMGKRISKVKQTCSETAQPWLDQAFLAQHLKRRFAGCKLCYFCNLANHWPGRQRNTPQAGSDPCQND